MSKRPAFNLSDLTSEAAAPMQEAVQRAQRTTPPAPTLAVMPEAESVEPEVRDETKQPAKVKGTPTANLQGLAFKVSPAFRKRFRQRAANADLKLNELLFAALEAWEEKSGLKK